jgi:hypothetical protein
MTIAVNIALSLADIFSLYFLGLLSLIGHLSHEIRGRAIHRFGILSGDLETAQGSNQHLPNVGKEQTLCRCWRIPAGTFGEYSAGTHSPERQTGRRSSCAGECRGDERPLAPVTMRAGSVAWGRAVRPESENTLTQ